MKARCHNDTRIARSNLFSEEGFLLLHGPRRLWLITLSGPERTTATMTPATVQTFHRETAALIYR